MYNFCQAQSQSNPISIDWVTEKALSLLNTNDHLGSATNPPPGIVRGKGPRSVKSYGEVSFNKNNTIQGNLDN